MRWPWQRAPQPAPVGERNAAREALYRAQRRLDEAREQADKVDRLAEQVRRALGLRP